MNYYSHFLSLEDRTHPYTVLGSILPDLARDGKPDYTDILDESMRFKKKDFDYLSLGIWSHIESDKWFHNSEFFKANTKEIARMVRDSSNISLTKYTYFLAHILLELIVDREYMRGSNDDVVRFYDLLRQTSDEVIVSFFAEHLPRYDVELFLARYEHFCERKFLHNYQNIDTVVNVTYHIFERVGIQHLKDEDKIGLTHLIEHEITPLIAPQIDGMMIALKKNIWGKSWHSIS